jgi:hypothetical protein
MKILSSLSKKLNTFSSYFQPLTEVSKNRKVLLIRAHPTPESFSASLAEAAKKGLQSAGHEVCI